MVAVSPHCERAHQSLIYVIMQSSTEHTAKILPLFQISLLGKTYTNRNIEDDQESCASGSSINYYLFIVSEG